MDLEKLFHKLPDRDPLFGDDAQLREIFDIISSPRPDILTLLPYPTEDILRIFDLLEYMRLRWGGMANDEQLDIVFRSAEKNFSDELLAYVLLRDTLLDVPAVTLSSGTTDPCQDMSFICL